MNGCPITKLKWVKNKESTHRHTSDLHQLTWAHLKQP